MEIIPYNSQYKNDCIKVFKSNIPEYFAKHELGEFVTWLETGQLNNYYVVKSEEALLGCGGIYIDEANNKAGFAWGMIDRDHHNKGLGKIFSEFRINKIKEISDLPIFLVTSQHTFEFYRKLGFAVISFEKDGFCEGLDKYDMKYTL